MASALLYLGMKDDDDYSSCRTGPEFWITKLPGTDQFVYIPKPFEIGALGSVWSAAPSWHSVATISAWATSAARWARSWPSSFR